MAKHTNDAVEIGASKIASIMHMSPWQTANEVLGIVRAARAGTPVENIANNNMKWGTYAEPGIRQWIKDDLGWEIEEPTDAFRLGPKGLASSLDGIIKCKTMTIVDCLGVEHKVVGDGNLEIKTVPRANDTPPLYYQLQMQAQMMTAGLSWSAYVEVPRDRPELRVHVVFPHMVAQLKIAEAVRDFWRRVETGESYPAANPDEGVRLFAKAAPKSEIDLTTNNEIGELVDDLAAARRSIKAGEEIEANTMARIMEIMGENEIGILADGRRVVWPMRSYKATPEKITPAKPARTIRLSTIEIKEAV